MTCTHDTCDDEPIYPPVRRVGRALADIAFFVVPLLVVVALIASAT